MAINQLLSAQSPSTLFRVYFLSDLISIAFAEEGSNAKKLPGAALLSLSFTPKDVNNHGASRVRYIIDDLFFLRICLRFYFVQGLQDPHAGYENAIVEIAASLQLSRNIFFALLSLQSWEPFVRRWMRADILYFDAKSPPIILDKTSKAANDILKVDYRLELPNYFFYNLVFTTDSVQEVL